MADLLEQRAQGVSRKKLLQKPRDAQSSALCPDCDIFIVTLCSLRKDHVSAYGEISNLTPSIDKIAKEGAVFTKTSMHLVLL